MPPNEVFLGTIIVCLTAQHRCERFIQYVSFTPIHTIQQSLCSPSVGIFQHTTAIKVGKLKYTHLVNNIYKKLTMIKITGKSLEQVINRKSKFKHINPSLLNFKLTLTLFIFFLCDRFLYPLFFCAVFRYCFYFDFTYCTNIDDVLKFSVFL